MGRCAQPPVGRCLSSLRKNTCWLPPDSWDSSQLVISHRPICVEFSLLLLETRQRASGAKSLPQSIRKSCWLHLILNCSSMLGRCPQPQENSSTVCIVVASFGIPHLIFASVSGHSDAVPPNHSRKNSSYTLQNKAFGSSGGGAA